MKASMKFLRIAPRKVRLVADMIRGKNVEEALNILQFTTKSSAKPMAKLVKSAVANADQKGGVNVDKLCMHFKVTSIENILAKDHDGVIRVLNQRKADKEIKARKKEEAA